MATKRKTETEDETTVVPEEKGTAAESVYSADELAANYRVFDTCYAIVKIALKMAGVEFATEAQARKIINEFKTKEIK